MSAKPLAKRAAVFADCRCFRLQPPTFESFSSVGENYRQHKLCMRGARWGYPDPHCQHNRNFWPRSARPTDGPSLLLTNLSSHRTQNSVEVPKVRGDYFGVATVACRGKIDSSAVFLGLPYEVDDRGIIGEQRAVNRSGLGQVSLRIRLAAKQRSDDRAIVLEAIRKSSEKAFIEQI